MHGKHLQGHQAAIDHSPTLPVLIHRHADDATSNAPRVGAFSPSPSLSLPSTQCYVTWGTLRYSRRVQHDVVCTAEHIRPTNTTREARVTSNARPHIECLTQQPFSALPWCLWHICPGGTLTYLPYMQCVLQRHYCINLPARLLARPLLHANAATRPSSNPICLGIKRKGSLAAQCEHHKPRSSCQTYAAWRKVPTMDKQGY